MKSSVGQGIAVALVELLLAVLWSGGMAHRLIVAEAILLAACDLGADRLTAARLLEAINGGEVERIRGLAEQVLATLSPQKSRSAAQAPG